MEKHVNSFVGETERQVLSHYVAELFSVDDDDSGRIVADDNLVAVPGHALVEENPGSRLSLIALELVRVLLQQVIDTLGEYLACEALVNIFLIRKDVFELGRNGSTSFVVVLVFQLLATLLGRLGILLLEVLLPGWLFR